MALERILHLTIILGCIPFGGTTVWSQTEPVEQPASSTAPTVPGEDLSQETTDSAEPPAPTEVPNTIERKSFTMGERKSICSRYNGDYIAYYGDVFKVENCLRRPIVNSKTVYQLLSQGVKPKNVEGDVIAALRVGAPLDYAESAKDARDCKQLEGQYVTFSSVNVYWVENCKRRMLPDWTTYLDHRSKRGERYGAIESLSWLEFSRLAEGEPIGSSTDDAFRKWIEAERETADVIPIDEACSPINGQYVFYYSNLYKIERCRKRLVDPQVFFRNRSNANLEIAEMTSEQWLSIPDGEPIGDNNNGEESNAPTSVYQH